MINVKKFVFDKLKNNTTLSWYVSQRIYPNTAPLNSAWPLIVYNRVTQWKLDLKGIRNEYIQISIWWKSINDNEIMLGVISSIFNGLKKAPVKFCDVMWFDETFDKETWTFWNHVTVHIKMIEDGES